MGTVLLIAFWLLLIFCLIIGAALVLPVRLELAVRKEADWQVTAAVRPFGRYGPRIAIKKGQPRANAKKPRKRKDRVPRRRMPRDVRSIFPAALRFVTDILQCIRVGRLTVDARFGLDDPAMTGQAFGMLAPVMYGAPAIPGIRVRVVPVFDQRVLVGAADIAFSVVPIMLVGPFIRLGWHFVKPTS